MKKLNLAPADQPPTAEAFIRFAELFKKPLSKEHIAAIRELFVAKGLALPAFDQWETEQ